MRKLTHIPQLGWAYKIAGNTALCYPPYQYTIEITNICNLHCVFCPQADPNHAAVRPHGSLHLDDLALFLRRVTEARPADRHINFTLDGEPFCSCDFLRCVDLAVSAGYFPVFATNATQLDRESADRLITGGPFRASIDFASSRDIFESIRGRAGDFDLVRRNLLYLMEQAKHHPGIHLDIHDISSFTGTETRESLRKMRSLFPGRLPRRVRFAARNFHNFCGHLGRPETGGRYRLCPYPWTQLAVTHTGDCVACCRDVCGRTVLGNVFRQSVMDIWNGPKYRELRQNLIDRRPDLHAACAACDLPYSSGPRWKIPYMARSLLGR